MPSPTWSPATPTSSTSTASTTTASPSSGSGSEHVSVFARPSSSAATADYHSAKRAAADKERERKEWNKAHNYRPDPEEHAKRHREIAKLRLTEAALRWRAGTDHHGGFDTGDKVSLDHYNRISDAHSSAAKHMKAAADIKRKYVNAQRSDPVATVDNSPYTSASTSVIQGRESTRAEAAATHTASGSGYHASTSVTMHSASGAAASVTSTSYEQHTKGSSGTGNSLQYTGGSRTYDHTYGMANPEPSRHHGTRPASVQPVYYGAPIMPPNAPQYYPATPSPNMPPAPAPFMRPIRARGSPPAPHPVPSGIPMPSYPDMPLPYYDPRATPYDPRMRPPPNYNVTPTPVPVTVPPQYGPPRPSSAAPYPAYPIRQHTPLPDLSRLSISERPSSVHRPSHGVAGSGPSDGRPGDASSSRRRSDGRG